MGTWPSYPQHNLHHHNPHPSQKHVSPSRQRRRERREAARKAKAEEAVLEETAEEAVIEETAEDVANEETAEETIIVEDNEKAAANDEKIIEAAKSHENDNNKTITDTAVEVAVGAIADELYPDTEFDAVTPSEEWKTICTVDFYPIKKQVGQIRRV